jgi:hypothetical protein
VLKNKYEEIYTRFMKKPGSDQAQELQEVLKAYNRLQVALLSRMRGDGMEAQLRDLTAAAETATEMVPICLETLGKMKNMQALAAESSEIAAISRLLRDASSSGDSSADRQVAVMQALHRWCELLSRSIDQLRDSSEGSLEALKMLEPVSADLSQLVQETAASDAEMLTRLLRAKQRAYRHSRKAHCTANAVLIIAAAERRRQAKRRIAFLTARKGDRRPALRSTGRGQR